MCFCATVLQAQTPTWAVTPSNFTYSMNVTNELSIACEDLEAPTNLIGAFVGTDCRGVAYSSNVVTGNYLAFLTVYGNSVSGDTITFKIYDASLDSVFDAATQILFQDGAAFGFPTTPFKIVSNNQPDDVVISSDSVMENSLNAMVGSFTSSDVDAGSTFTYGLVPGLGDTDNGSFTISGDQLIVNGTFDFATKDSYKVRVATNDGECSFEKEFVIFVKDSNDLPTDIAISANTIDENKAIGTSVGNFSTVDEDVNDTFTYTLIAGNGDADNAKFNIVAGDLVTTQLFDFETKDTLYIRVETEDSKGETFEKEFLIFVNDINDAPTDLVVSSASFMENKVLGAVALSFSTVDQDLNDVHNYAFNSDQSSDNNLFTIVGNELRTNSLFDFETNTYYTIRVSTFDLAGAVYTEQIILTVLDSNDAPYALNVSNRSVYENAPIGSFIGKISTSDQDAVDAYTYSLTTGLGDLDNGSFTISNDSIFTNSLHNLNVQSVFYVRLQTEDKGGITFEKQDTITIVNSNDSPSDIQLSANTIDEMNMVNATVAMLTSTDQDVNDIHTYTLVVGNGSADNSKFFINGTTIELKDVSDYEAQSVYLIRLETNDGNGGVFEKEFQIIVVNVNEHPMVNDTILTVSEHVNINTIIGNLTYADPDSNEVFTFEVLGVSTFIMDQDSIELNEALDYEDEISYTFYVEITDANGLTDTAEVVVNVKDEIEADLPLPVNKIISPNGDGKNDNFHVQNVENYKDYKLTIFNNNGLVIFEVDENYDNSWKGTYSGDLVEEGVYYYVFINKDDASLFYKGTISLIR